MEHVNRIKGAIVHHVDVGYLPLYILPLSHLVCTHQNSSTKTATDKKKRQQKEMSKSAEEEQPQKAFGWAARDNSGILSPFHFSRRYTCIHILLPLLSAKENHFFLVSSLFYLILFFCLLNFASFSSFFSNVLFGYSCSRVCWGCSEIM